MTHDEIGALRDDWKRLYGETLPSLVISKSPVQDSWPVHVDHCFGRIILDNVIGENEPWMNKLNSPAIKNMSSEQLKKCIALGNAIAEGKQSLADLDGKSLQLRGKKPKPAANSKRKREESVVKASDKKRQIDIRSALSKESEALSPTPTTISPSRELPKPRTIDTDLHHLITTAHLTPFRQSVLVALCQVPSGRFTSYAALSTHLQSSARAVGNALRNNPFAPRVPCHRVVAADKSLGGFGGDWGMQGKHAGEKVKLLRGEGVVVDSGKGKVEGSIWTGFQ